MSRPPIAFQRTYVTPATADLRTTYIRDTIVVDDTGADVPLLLPKIGTAYAPVGRRVTIVKASNAPHAVVITPATLDAVTSDVPGAFPDFGAPGVANDSALPSGQPGSVMLEATDMSLTASPQPNPSGGTPTTAGAWLAIGSGTGGSSTNETLVTIYVETAANGGNDDNPGTQALPKLTLQNALATAPIAREALVIQMGKGVFGSFAGVRSPGAGIGATSIPVDPLVQGFEVGDSLEFLPSGTIATLTANAVIGDTFLSVMPLVAAIPTGDTYNGPITRMVYQSSAAVLSDANKISDNVYMSTYIRGVLENVYPAVGVFTSSGASFDDDTGLVIPCVGAGPAALDQYIGTAILITETPIGFENLIGLHTLVSQSDADGTLHFRESFGAVPAGTKFVLQQSATKLVFGGPTEVGFTSLGSGFAFENIHLVSENFVTFTQGVVQTIYCLTEGAFGAFDCHFKNFHSAHFDGFLGTGGSSFWQTHIGMTGCVSKNMFILSDNSSTGGETSEFIDCQLQGSEGPAINLFASEFRGELYPGGPDVNVQQGSLNAFRCFFNGFTDVAIWGSASNIILDDCHGTGTGTAVAGVRLVDSATYLQDTNTDLTADGAPFLLAVDVGAAGVFSRADVLLGVTDLVTLCRAAEQSPTP